MLTSLQIHNFRNLTHVNIAFEAKFNLLYGNNGSGKTSFLEAIHYLGLARSFRTHLNARLIQNEQEKFSVYGIVEQNNISIPLGIQREQKQEGQIRINGKNAESTLELASILPLQFIDGETHRLFLNGSKPRRQFLDWGVFHVEHSFTSVWQWSLKAVKQRNAALRLQQGADEIQLWEKELVLAAKELHHFRQQYMVAFIQEFTKISKVLLPGHEITLSYYQGWPIKENLTETLEKSRKRDMELGYSQFGPHKADLLLRIGNTPLHDALSQGQQKLVLYALRLTQGILFSRQTKKRCVFLIDDLPSELDKPNQDLVTQILTELNAQIFITGIHKEDLIRLFAKSQQQMFHVEHGGLG